MSSQRKVRSLIENVKYDWPAISAPNDSGRWGGGGRVEMEQSGPKHTVCALVVSVKIASRIVASVWNSRAVKPMFAPLAPWKKNPRFLRKKKKKERPFALTESYCFLHCYWKSEKEKSYTRSPRGVPREYIRYPIVPGNLYVSVGCKTHLRGYA